MLPADTFIQAYVYAVILWAFALVTAVEGQIGSISQVLHLPPSQVEWAFNNVVLI